MAALSILASTFLAARRAASFAALTTESASIWPATAAVRPAAIAILARRSVTVALLALARNAFHIIWMPHGAAATCVALRRPTRGITGSAKGQRFVCTSTTARKEEERSTAMSARLLPGDHGVLSLEGEAPQRVAAGVLNARVIGVRAQSLQQSEEGNSSPSVVERWAFQP